MPSYNRHSVPRDYEEVSGSMSGYSVALHASNLLILVVIGLPILLLYLLGTPYQRGFFCDDSSLAHPYLPDTITTTVLYLVDFLVPLAAILAVEIGLRERKTHKDVTFGKHLYRVPSVVSKVYHAILGYLLGAAVSQCLTDTAKYSVGRLRPHFFDVCNVNWAELNPKCTDEFNRPVFIVDYECPPDGRFTDREHSLVEARLSFVSGHASFATQAMVFVILYLQARLSGRRFRIWFMLPLMQLCAFVFAFYTCLSRVGDYRHHPGDVAAGAILGAAVQVVNVFCVMKLFSGSKRKKRVAAAAAELDEEEGEKKRLRVEVATTGSSRAYNSTDAVGGTV